MNERVIHVRDRGQYPASQVVYIGRRNNRHRLPDSPWRNPFVVSRDGTREQVIDMYRAWLLAQPTLIARLPELRDKILMCWCAPEPCHGNVLIALLEELYPEKGAKCNDL